MEREIAREGEREREVDKDGKRNTEGERERGRISAGWSYGNDLTGNV